MSNTFATRFIFCIGLLIQVTEGKAQTLFTYGDKTVSSKAFLRAFNKNPGEAEKKKAMEAYLPLYTNYVLKVQDAYDLRLDTLENQKQELMDYKIQLAEGYIAEKSGSDKLVDEAIQRMQEDVLLGQIFIAYENGDTASAIAMAAEAIKQLKAGKSWSEVALQFSSDDKVNQHKGIIGWIGPFLIPYPYETLVYNLPTGGYTQPIRASSGIHIFSKRQTRPGTGTIQVAQILIADMPGLGQQERSNRSKLADSIYNLLQKGAKFEYLVSEFSEDRSTKYSGGIMEPFGVGAYDAGFEAQAISLSKPGDLSKPFKSEFGWHILKLVAKTPPPAKDDENARMAVKQKVTSDSRLETSRNSYVKANLPAMKYKPGTISKAKLQVFTDSLLNNADTKPTGLTDKNVLFSFAKQAYTIADWTAFARVQSMDGSMEPGENIAPFYDAFIFSKASDYLPQHLDQLDAEFALQYKEFKDANLLFEAMERNVWGKAMSDTIALQKYYDTHREKYHWDENMVAILVTGSDSLMVSEARQSLIKDPTQWRALNEGNEGRIYADSARFESGVFAFAKNSSLERGSYTSSELNPLDGSYSFAYIIEKGTSGMPRTFEEARGFVVSDYQIVLEETWIKRLKKKYPVKVVDAEWKKLLAAAN